MNFQEKMEILTECEGCGNASTITGFCRDCRSSDNDGDWRDW